MLETIIEAHVGGRCYTRQTDGTDRQWGTILEWEPPRRFVLEWQVNPAWEHEPDIACASEVELRFTPEDGGYTRVDLEHRHFERHREGFEAVQTAVSDPDGWTQSLEVFRSNIDASKPETKRPRRKRRPRLKRFDQAFAVFLLIGAAGHTAGTFLLVPSMSDLWVWSLGAALAAMLLGALNLMRAARPRDTTLALVTTSGTALWALIALLFGKSIENVWDPRVVMHFVTSVVLVCFGVNTLRLQRMDAVTNAAPPAQSTVSH